MPDTLYLQIESRERVASRVLTFASPSLRIGRGVSCEIRLIDPTLAEVECLLRRRGETWHVQPLNNLGRVSIDGRAVEHLRALAIGVPLRVGEHVLTLRSPVSTRPSYGDFGVPIPVGPSPASVTAGTDLAESRLDGRGYADPTARIGARSTTPARPAAFPVSDPDRGLDRHPSSAARIVLDPWRDRPPSASSPWSDDGIVAPDERTSPLDPGPRIVPFPTVDFSPEVDEPAADGSKALDSDATIAVEEVGPVTCQAESRPTVGDRKDIEPAIASEIGSTVAWDIAPAVPEVVHSASTEAPRIGAPTFSAVVGIDLKVTNQVESAGHAFADESASPVDPARRAEVPSPPLALSPPREKASRSAPPDPGPSRPQFVEAPLPELDDLEWPSARVILASHVATIEKAGKARTARPRDVRRPEPSASIAPSSWSLPAWLAATPMVLMVLAFGSAGTALSWQWGQDAREAGMIADRLLRSDETAPPFVVDDIGEDATWWRTTSAHLALKAAALGSAKPDATREDRVLSILHVARRVAPLEPSTRLSRAMRDPSGRDPSSLGLSRDVVALAQTGRMLAHRKKDDAALAAFRAALDMAVRADLPRGRVPSFLDGATSKRFALPNEDVVAEVVNDMADVPGWPVSTWSAGLPDDPLVLIATYRVLREREASADADAVLGRLLKLGPASTGPRTCSQTAWAEALAEKGRWEESASAYQDAIDSTDDESLRRAFCLNLGMILTRGGEKARAAEALLTARAGRGEDEIGRAVARFVAREGLRGATAQPASPASRAIRAN